MDVPDLDSPFEVIRDETGIISPMSAPQGRHEEGLLRMRLRILHKALECEVDLMGADVRADSRHGIALSLRSLGDSYPGTELPDGRGGCSSLVGTVFVASLCKRLHKAAYVKSEIM